MNRISSFIKSPSFGSRNKNLPVTLCMLGLIGAGKSWLGNEILGKELFAVSSSFMEPVTNTVECHENFIESFSSTVRIVDVPGFGNFYGRD